MYKLCINIILILSSYLINIFIYIHIYDMNKMCLIQLNELFLKKYRHKTKALKIFKHNIKNYEFKS